MQRWRRLPGRGLLMVSTDLHGNGDDFRRLRQHYLGLRQDTGPVFWCLLGDTVHAPDETARRRRPDLYDFADESLAIVEGILALMEAYPGEVLYVLGNHDHGHAGGPHTGKFYRDEVDHLEEAVGPAGVAALRRLFEPALLAVAAPCGVLLTHGSPDDRLATLDDLDDVHLTPGRNDAYHAHLLETFLTSYGQAGEVTARLLARLSTEDLSLRLVVHGHDRDEAGWFVEGGNQVCPVIFGAARANKCFLVLDLASRYAGVEDLREGVEVRRVYGQSGIED
jgi:hypothetical protein